MAEIKFSQGEKDAIISKLQAYFLKELDFEIGRFDAEFLFNFFTREIGAFFYNRGLYDAQAVLSRRVEELLDLIYELEKPTDLQR